MRFATIVASLGLGCATLFGQAISDRPGWCNFDVAEPTPPLPRAVIAAVLGTKEARPSRTNAIKFGRDPYSDAPLGGVRVDVAGKNHRTYLVLGGSGNDMNLTGADNRWYWVVERKGLHAKILLFAHTGCLHLSKKRTNGYSDIIADWRSTTLETYEQFAFDGHVYRRVKNSTRYMCELVPPEDRKECESNNKALF